MRLIVDDCSAAPPPLGTAVDRGRLLELYRHQLPDDPAAVSMRSNFVVTLDGSIQGPDGRSGSINTPSDHEVFAVHRAVCDAVLVGNGTARAEGYRAVDLEPWQRDARERLGLSPWPTLIVVSRSGRLNEGIGTPPGDHGDVLLITTATDVTPPDGVELLTLPGDELDLRAAATALAARGLRRVLCEGGPALHRDLLNAGLVDQLSLTLSPLTVGGVGARTTSGQALTEPTRFTLAFSLLGDDGALFTHYRRR